MTLGRTALTAKIKFMVTAGVASAMCAATVVVTATTVGNRPAPVDHTPTSGSLVLGNTVQSGRVCLSTGGPDAIGDRGPCEALFDLTTRQPGDFGAANFTLENRGTTAAGNVRVYGSACADGDAHTEAYHGSASPCSSVQLIIQEWKDPKFSVPSLCVYGGGDGARCDWSNASKTLGAYGHSHGVRQTAQSVGGPLAAGAARYFTVAVRLPPTAQNTLQGRAATQDFNWELLQ